MARRERLKKMIVQHDADELALEPWLGPEILHLDVAELSTDKDAEGTPINRAPPPTPPSMVVALPHGLPPTRADIPSMRNRRRGKPRKPSIPSQLLLRWPEDVTREAQKRERPLLYDSMGVAVLE